VRPNESNPGVMNGRWSLSRFRFFRQIFETRPFSLQIFNSINGFRVCFSLAYYIYRSSFFSSFLKTIFNNNGRYGAACSTRRARG